MPTPHHSVFTGWMPFLQPNQQRQSMEVPKKHQKTLQIHIHNMTVAENVQSIHL